MTDYVFCLLVLDKAYEGKRPVGSNGEEAESRLCQGEYLFDFVVLTLFIFCMYIRPAYALQKFSAAAIVCARTMLSFLIPSYVLHFCEIVKCYWAFVSSYQSRK